jgi:hypothetical protein
MTKETLLYALEAERLKPGSDGSVAIPDDRDATVMVAGSGETIQVGKVVKINLHESVLCLEAAKGERYWFTYDLLLGLRLTTVKNAKEHATGFSK